MRSGRSRIILIRAALAAALAILLNGADFADAAPMQLESNAEVTTIAGDGLPGLEDGRPGRFLLPTGLALGKDGTIYVADAAAQRIKTISRDGFVRTIAGGGAIGRLSWAVPGAFADGRALSARFNYPTALAINPVSGALYIADSANGCIRRLDKGVITTIAGKAGERVAVDGPQEKSRLVDPSALAFDPSGTLYIADFGVGLRRLDVDGTLTTIKFKSNGDVRFLSLSLAPSANGALLLASTPDTLFAYRIDNKTDVAFGFGDAFISEGNVLGRLNQIAALDDREFVFTDLLSQTVRYARLPAPPFVSTVLGRAIAGGSSGNESQNAGFKDGGRLQARFSSPMGIVVDGRAAIVADGINRRIRRIALPAFRVSEAGLVDPASYDAAHYQVVYIGQSSAFWNSLGDDSFCAIVEKRLNESRRFPKPVRCHTVRIDSGSLTQFVDYVENYLVDQHVDLIALGMNPSVVGFSSPSPTPGQSTASRVHDLLGPFAAKLTAKGIRLGLCWYFHAGDISDAESNSSLALTRQLTWPGDHGAGRDEIRTQIFPALRDLPIVQYDSFDDFLRHEKAADPLPLYMSQDAGHLSPQGTATLANGFAAFLIAHATNR